MFVQNAWYVIAWDYEIGRSLMRRTVLNEPVVLYRKNDGTPVALEDACSHRKAPLSMGRIKDGKIECRYHGLTFDGDGTCVHVPGQNSVPEEANVRAYQLCEKWHAVWIWMGDQDKADETLIPDLHWNGDENWEMMRDVLPMKANYQLMVDNLMDLTHLAYLHQESIGNTEMAEYANVKTRRTDSGVVMERFTEGNTTPAFYRELRNLPEIIDRQQYIEFVPPACVIIESSAAPAESGLKDGDKSQSKSHMILNFVTPETDNTLIYFWSNLRNYRLDDKALSHEYHDGLCQVFDQDKEMCEAQQHYFETHPDTEMVDFNVDTAQVEARRIVDRQIADEQTAGIAAE